MRTTTITRAQAKDLIRQSKGRFITVKFVKKDGSERVLNGLYGVKKHLKGGERTVPEDTYEILYDVHKKGYRAVNITTLQEIHANGKIFKIVDTPRKENNGTIHKEAQKDN